MTQKDRLRFVIAKILRRKTVLFSKNNEWGKGIKKFLKRDYCPFFYDFDEVKVDHFDAVIPLSIQAQKYINAHPALRIHGKGIIPSDTIIDLCNDKLKFNQFMQSNRFGNYIPQVANDIGYPYILKKRIGSWGLDIVIVNNADDAAKYGDMKNSSDYFTQEFIGGKEEYSGHLILKEHKVVLFKVLKFVFESDSFVKGKTCKFKHVEEVDHSHFQDIFEQILSTIGYQGLCAIIIR